MSRIHVVIAKTSTGMYWDSVERLLESDSGLVISSCQYGSALKEFLQQHQPQVLILEKSKNENQEFLESIPELAIIVLDPISNETLVNLQNVGSKYLIELIKNISSSVNKKAVQYVNLNKSSSVENNIQLQSISNNDESHNISVLPYSDDKQHLNSIKQWLDLMLLEVLSQEDEVTNQLSAPGWALNVNQVRDLIGGSFSKTKESTLHSARLNLENEIAQREQITQASVNHIKVLWIVRQFNLNDIERWILLLIISSEIDAKYASVFGYLNDNLTRRWPTATLLSRLISTFLRDLDSVEILKLISTHGSIAEHGLVELEDDHSLSTSDKAVKPADEILEYILNDSVTPQSFEVYIELIQCTSHKPLHLVDRAFTNTKLNNLWGNKQQESSLPVLQLSGDAHIAEWFTKLSYRSAYSILTLDVSRIPSQDINRLDHITASASRIAKLYDSILLIVGFDSIDEKSTPEWFQSQLISRLCKTVQRLAIGSKSILTLPNTIQLIHIQKPALNLEKCKKAWLRVTASLGTNLSQESANELASIFRFDDSSILKTIRLSTHAKGETIDLQTIKKNACLVARVKLPSSIKLVNVEYNWDDIVLSKSTKEKLRRMPTHVRFADRVFEDWGFKKRMPYGRSVATLLTGVSGTGKTMASQIIANDLGVDLFQVDLSKTVSKYIGETEKNLDQVFTAAEKSFAVLLFDEADAIFGKRSEVRDAHDRYANIEVAYLLQRIESYTGIIILTTNFRQNLDAAFMRRMRFVINFEEPDYEARLKIWKRVFPNEVEFEKQLDFSFLARRLELTGGNIQQIAVRAAFSAATESSAISMRHIVNATREEAEKLGMSNVEKTLELMAA